MTLAYYSLDNSISGFFKSHTNATRQQCDELAASLVGGPISPVQIQGAFSYTVTAGAGQSKIVQFRAQCSLLDVGILKLAREIHGQIVPSCIYHGNVGECSPLTVYEMEKLPGITYIEWKCNTDHFAMSSGQIDPRYANTVISFARFYAATWSKPQMKLSNMEAKIRLDCENKIDTLYRKLPSRFTKILGTICRELPLIFTSEYPMVLSHSDLCEMNILVDPDSGNITGVIDWADAKTLPFGFSLWGYMNLLGTMNSKGWQYHSNYRTLDRLFWMTFQASVGDIAETHRRAIRIARLTGLFLRYGFAWDNGIVERPAEETDSSLSYLDAFFPSSGSPPDSVEYWDI